MYFLAISIFISHCHNNYTDMDIFRFTRIWIYPDMTVHVNRSINSNSHQYVIGPFTATYTHPPSSRNYLQATLWQSSIWQRRYLGFWLSNQVSRQFASMEGRRGDGEWRTWGLIKTDIEPRCFRDIVTASDTGSPRIAFFWHTNPIKPWRRRKPVENLFIILNPCTEPAKYGPEISNINKIGRW